MARTACLVLLLVVVLACLLAALLWLSGRGRRAAPPLPRAGDVRGGAGRPPKGNRPEQAPRSENLVVDTLNLAHWLRRRATWPGAKKVGLCDILATIDETAPALREKFPGRVIYVTKDRETKGEPDRAAQARALYQAAARRNRVFVDVVERLPAEAAAAGPRRRPHAALGRDDFYLLVTAWKLKCGVLSRDRFRDLADMKGGGLPPFHVFRYSPYGLPARDFVNPAAAEFRRMQRPFIFDPSELLPER